MASSSSAAADSSSAGAILDLKEELAIQQTILASLEDNHQQDDSDVVQVREAQHAIRDLRRRIKAMELQDSKKNASTSGASSSLWPPRDNRVGPSGRSTPAHPSAAGASIGPLQRKRPFPSHFDDDDSPGPYIKSYKTTPSPAQTGITTPSANDDFEPDDDVLVDLTGNDEDIEAVIKQQRAWFARHEQQKEDERVARNLELQLSQVEPPSPQPVDARPSGPNAFERILDRPSQTTGSSSGHTPSRGSGNAGSSNAWQPQHRMPGSFDMGDDDDEESYDFGPDDGDYEPLEPSDFNPWNTTSRTRVPTAADFLDPGYPPIQVPNVPAAELARRAALAAQGNYEPPIASRSTRMPGFSMPGTFPASYAGPSPYTATSVYRPGMLNSGSYNLLHGTGGFNMMPTNAYQANSSSVSDIIRQTGNIDWTNGVDALGNPLDDRLRSYYEDLQDDPRKTEEEIRDLLANIRPDEEIPEEDRVGTPEGLRYPLYPHQQLALKWMTDSEEGKNKGGILADDMGLGKTISALALMVSRQSSDRVKTNLIVGPVALIKQWETEIKKKTKVGHQLSVYMLHGNGKNAPYDTLRRFDVVLTTYGKLSHEQKRFDKWVEQHKGADAGIDVALAKSCPLLHPKSKFYRVILDEAQCIKNENTLQAKAASRLNANHRWCLTGTPMMNGINELYSLIKFLKIAPYHNKKEFTKMFGSLTSKSGRARASGEVTRNRAMAALRVLLKAIMLRRMKTSKLDGKPLLNLPPKTEEVVHVVFDEDERSYYTGLEARTKITFNKYLRAGTVGKNYSNVLVLLLRLRQACCHPHLNLDVEYVGNSEVSVEDMNTLAKTLAPEVVSRLKAANEEGFNCPICLDAVIDPTIVLPCGHNTCAECFSTLVAGAVDNNLRAGEEGSQLKCPECRGSIDPKKVINLTAFKAVHMPEPDSQRGAVDEADIETASEASDSDDDSSDSESDDGTDADDVDRNGNLKDFIVDDDGEEEAADTKDGDDDLFVPRASTSKKAKGKKARKSKGKSKGDAKGKGKAKAEEVKPHMLKTLRIEARKNKAEKKRYFRYLKKNWMPSAKVTKCCDILQGIQDSGDKTIVFSQFTFLLDLLEIPIKERLGIKFCRYDGGMTRQQRDDAAQDFQDPSSRTKVMLVSLKAGNAGLNLTAANHVIILDPFWNYFVESQAVDRAHRIGQQKPVQVHRLLVEETVEDRIINIQEQKRQFIDAALDEGESKQLGRLSLRDLQYLFNGRAD